MTLPRSPMCGESRDCGSAIVEYVLVLTLLVFIAIGIIQTALVLHARNVLVADAAEGARTAAARGAALNDGEQVCADLVRHSLPGATAAAARPCVAGVLAADDGSPELVRMTADATLALSLVPGGRIHLRAVGRAVREPR